MTAGYECSDCAYKVRLFRQLDDCIVQSIIGDEHIHYINDRMQAETKLRLRAIP